MAEVGKIEGKFDIYGSNVPEPVWIRLVIARLKFANLLEIREKCPFYLIFCFA